MTHVDSAFSIHFDALAMAVAYWSKALAVETEKVVEGKARRQGTKARRHEGEDAAGFEGGSMQAELEVHGSRHRVQAQGEGVRHDWA